VKVILGTEVRRLSFAKAPTLQTLVQMVGNLFNASLERVKPLVYRDDEDDVVTIGSDLELLEAIRLAEAAGKSLRLYVNRIEPGAEQIEDKDDDKPQPPQQSAPPSLSGAARDGTLLQELALRLSAAVASIKSAVDRAQIQAQLVQLKATAQREMANASDAVRPYLVAVQVYAVSALDSARVSESLQHLVATMNAQSARLLAQAQQLPQQLPEKVHQGFESLPEQLQHQLAALPGQIAAIPSQLAALPAQLASYIPPNIYPGQLPVHPPSQPAPTEEKKKAESPLPPDAAQQDLAVLEAMGFVDRERNVALLLKHKGSLERVVAELLCDEY